MVAAIDSKRVDLAKLQDRFRYRVDLAPSDIREVATRRVLAKKPGAIPILTKLYNDHQGQLNAALRLERTTRKTEITGDDFVNFYPYPPHYLDLTASAHSCAACVVWRDGHRLDIFDPVIVPMSPQTAAHYDPIADLPHGQTR